MNEEPLYKREWIQLAVLLLFIAAANVMVQVENGVAWDAINWNAVLAAAFFAGCRVLGKSRQDAARMLRQQIPIPQTPVYPPNVPPIPDPVASPGVPFPTPAVMPARPTVKNPSPLAPDKSIPMTDDQRRVEIDRLNRMRANLEGGIKKELGEDARVVGRDGA